MTAVGLRPSQRCTMTGIAKLRIGADGRQYRRSIVEVEPDLFESIETAMDRDREGPAPPRLCEWVRSVLESAA